MTDATQTQRSSSVAFALGQLTGQVVALKDTQDKFITTINDRDGRTDRRLTSLERNQWIWIGGGGVIITVLTGVLFGHPVAIKLW